MPYYRKRRAYKKYTKKSSGTSNLNRYISLASKAFKLASFVASVINPEVKTCDTNVSNFGQGTTPTVTHLSSIAQGDGPNDRNGDSIKSKDLLIRGNVQIPLASEGTYHVCRFRIIAVVDTQNQGTPPTMAEVLDSSGDLIDAPREQQTQVGNRFNHIFDRRITLTVGGRQSADFKQYIKLGHHIHYSGALSTNELAGNIWIMYVSDQNTNPPVLDFSSRLSYYDN